MPEYENKSLREVNLALKNHENPAFSKKEKEMEHPQPMFFSKGQHEKTMIRAQFFLINREADPTFLFQGLLHELPSINNIFTIDEQVYQVKDFTRTLIPGRDPEKVREGDVRILVLPKKVYG
jgi:hypothetical protein